MRSRVRSYFASDLARTRGEAIARMVAEARSVSWETCESALEAIVAEARLIKKHQPPYNTKEKSDKSFFCIAATKEEFPRIILMREKEIADAGGRKAFLFVAGPFPRASAARDALRALRKIFPFRDKCAPGTGKPCFHRQIGLCPGVCTGEIGKKEYRRGITRLNMFLSGKKRTLLRALEREMKARAAALDFEEAERIKKTIFSLTHIRDAGLFSHLSASPAGVARIEAFDIAHISGSHTVGVMVVRERGEMRKSAYRKFRIRGAGVNDPAHTEEVIRRRLSHPEWGMPEVIVTDGGIAQKRAAERAVRAAGARAKVVSVVKDARHRPKEILGAKDIVRKYEKDILAANAEAHRFALSYHRRLREKMPR